MIKNRFLLLLEKIQNGYYYFCFENHGKTRLGEKSELYYDLMRKLELMHDDFLNDIYHTFTLKKYKFNRNMIDKFIKFNSDCFDICERMLKCEKYDCNNDTSITIIYEIPSMLIAQKHICNCSFAIAKSYERHFEKLNKNAWDDYNQTGLYCLINSRNYCTNHDDFEYDYVADDIEFEIDYNI